MSQDLAQQIAKRAADAAHAVATLSEQEKNAEQIIKKTIIDTKINISFIYFFFQKIKNYFIWNIIFYKTLSNCTAKDKRQFTISNFFV